MAATAIPRTPSSRTGHRLAVLALDSRTLAVIWVLSATSIAVIEARPLSDMVLLAAFIAGWSSAWSP